MRCLLSMSTSYVCGGWNKFNCGQKYYWQDHMISFQTRGQQFHSTIKWQLRKHFLCVSFPPTTSPLFLLTIIFCSLEIFAKKRLKIINKFMFALTFEKLPMSSLSFYYLIIIIILLISKRENHMREKNTRFEKINEIS